MSRSNHWTNCHDCKGTGEELVTHHDAVLLRTTKKFIDCSLCHGTGENPVTERSWTKEERDQEVI